MKKNQKDAIDERQEELSGRLDRRWKPETDRPVLGCLGGGIEYEISERTRGVDCGGLGLIAQLVALIGLSEEIDNNLDLLKRHLPYHESDHILNITYNLLTGGENLEDIKLRREDINYLDALSAQRIPAPTTAGDFLRRFGQNDISKFMNVIAEVSKNIWLKKPQEEKEIAVFDFDGTLTDFAGECKEGADFSYKGTWGYGPLVCSLANSGEVLFIVNRSGNRPSHDGAKEWMDKAAAWAMAAGFKSVRFRGDTDFALTKNFDRWTEQGIQFAFGIDAHRSFVNWADSLDVSDWTPLERKGTTENTEPRSRPFNFKEAAVVAREYENQKLQAEHVAEIKYQPTKAKHVYRMIILRKNISVERGETLLLDKVKYFFYVTNISPMPQEEVIFENNARCNQENLIKQLKSGVHAFKSPAVEFNANWAYMIIGSLAWNLKTWLGLVLPKSLYPGFDPSIILRMEFRTFLRKVISVPAQILRSGRRLVFRLLSCPQMVHLLIDGSNWFKQQRFAY
ncbi:MAG: IS1380 family transposase [Gammaproteobacteria bacterium]|nr:IS1380 family transposase [Gammaproteobacteria bacterium]